MLNPDEIGRVADAVTAIRPEWNPGKIADYLEEHHAHRAFHVLAAAAVYVAADPAAKDLTGLELPGRWWIVPAEPRRPAPVERKIGPKRDEAWWARFNAAAAQRAAVFNYPKAEADQ